MEFDERFSKPRGLTRRYGAALTHLDAIRCNEASSRPPIPLERMPRVDFPQLWFNLSDPAVEEALYDSTSMRGFVGIDLGVEAAPDETTVCKSGICWRSTSWARSC